MCLTVWEWDVRFVAQVMFGTNITRGQARLCLKYAKQDLDYSASPEEEADTELGILEVSYTEEEEGLSDEA